MRWLYSPKVRLGLIVNGLYFISLFTPTAPHRRPRLYARTHEARAERAAHVVPPGYAPLPPPSGPSRATAVESGRLLHVSLSNDLTLVKKPGRTLLFSPSFDAVTRPPEEVELGPVSFRFILFSDQQICPADDCQFTVTADGVSVWPERRRDNTLYFSPGWARESVPHSSKKLDDGRVVETTAAESLTMKIPYDLFFEIISARQVTIGLGPDRVELTAEQIEALRDMHRLLPQPPPPGETDVDYESYRND